MDVYEALYTTRAMRRVRPDPIPLDVQARILDAAVRAPSGGNMQNWRFVLVDDPELRAKLGSIYRECIDELWATARYKERIENAEANPDAPSSRALRATMSSVEHAANHFAAYPLLLFAFQRGDHTGASTFPAVWSAQLAARAEGVGSTLTAVLSFKGSTVPDLLGMPSNEGWEMAACVTMGYPTGRWGIAPRNPAQEVVYRNRWGKDAGFTVDEPLWSPGG